MGAALLAESDVWPDVLSIEQHPDQVAAWAATAPLGEGVLTPFGVLDPETLSTGGRLDALLALERVKAWADAQQARLLAALAAHPGPVPAASAGTREFVAQEYIREEVACALRWSPGVAGERLHTATTLVDRLPATLDLLEEGRFGYLHAASLVSAVHDLDQTVTGKIEQRVLARAATQTLSEFRRAVKRAVASLDPRGQADKHHAAAKDRRVGCRPEADAMAWLSAYLPADDAQTVLTAIQAVADKLKTADTAAGCERRRTADQLRADALTAICVGVLTGTVIDGLPQWQGRRPSVHVVVALSTLLGLDDQPGELDGYGPIPADVARRIAADPTGTWRRLVTDPTGQLIDYGRTRYRPPPDLRDHVTTRDRTCRGIGCHRTAARCDLDHIQDFADGGQTNAANLDPKCKRDHHLNTTPAGPPNDSPTAPPAGPPRTAGPTTSPPRPTPSTTPGRPSTPTTNPHPSKPGRNQLGGPHPTAAGTRPQARGPGGGAAASAQPTRSALDQERTHCKIRSRRKPPTLRSATPSRPVRPRQTVRARASSARPVG